VLDALSRGRARHVIIVFVGHSRTDVRHCVCKDDNWILFLKLQMVNP
jgi:hypothetical protein